MIASTDEISYGLLALALFVSGLAWLALRKAPEVGNIAAIPFPSENRVIYWCGGCKRQSELLLPASADYVSKFEAAFRLLHARCAK